MEDNKLLLLGDEAVALGAIHAGLSGVYAYPGTPSTEITEYIQSSPLARERGIHCQWSCNEKTAMEAALGMSYMGKRAMVCMKHVGMNVAADAFVNSAMTGANGGLVVVAADDPSMHSSQNEQDSRFYGKFALMPTFEPSTQQEAYEMIGEAFDLSERYRIPVLMRLVTRMAHSRTVVTVGKARGQNALSYPANPRQWVLMPACSKERYKVLVREQADFLAEAENSRLTWQDLQKTLLREVESAYLDAVSAQSQYRAATEKERYARQSFELTQEQFNLGVKNTVELITAQNEWSSARQEVLQAKYMALLNIELLNIYQGRNTTTIN